MSSSLRRRSKRSSVRVGNKISKLVRMRTRGRSTTVKKVFKIKKSKDGREYYVSGKKKTRHYLSKRRSSRRSFGDMKDSLSNMMGNFRPAQMSLAESTTGFGPDQMAQHMADVPPSLLPEFYTSKA